MKRGHTNLPLHGGRAPRWLFQRMKQLSGSGVANLLTIFALLVVWIVKNKCKHSQCESDTSCCKCKVKEDDDSIREEAEGEMRAV